jgi:hypothetical protein
MGVVSANPILALMGGSTALKTGPTPLAKMGVADNPMWPKGGG